MEVIIISYTAQYYLSTDLYKYRLVSSTCSTSIYYYITLDKYYHNRIVVIKYQSEIPPKHFQVKTILNKYEIIMRKCNEITENQNPPPSVIVPSM